MSSTLNISSTVITEMRQLTFGWTDYLLFIGLLGISLIIGIYFGFFSKQDSASEYLFGGRTMAYIPVAVSILASLLSGITFLGVPTEVYFHGAQFTVSFIPAIINCLITVYVFIPIFYNLKISSTYEYLEMRFSKTIRRLASFLYTISLLIYIPIVIYVPALAFSQVTGYNIHTITPIFSMVCITYTTMGGVKAVVWTDTIQFIFTIGGLITILSLGIKAIGGFTNVWEIAEKGGRLDIFDMNPSPFERTTFWGMTIGQLFSTLSRFAIGQKFIQRFLAIDSKTNIRKAMFLLAVGWIILHQCCIFTGLLVYAKYHDCDPLEANLVKRNDQILPHYIMDIAGNMHGLPGLFLAGLVSSALSTMSASLNTLSGIIYEDFIDGWIPDSPTKDRKSANIMKVLSLIIGLITIGFIFVIERLGTVFEMSNSLGSIVDGPLLGLFILGMFVPWVGKKGAISGGCISIAFMSLLVGGMQWSIFNKRLIHTNLPTSIENCSSSINETLHHSASITEPTFLVPIEEPIFLFRISFLYLVMIGMIVTIITGLITSLIIGETDLSKIDPELIIPCLRRFLPEKKYIEVSLKEVTDEKIKT